MTQAHSVNLYAPSGRGKVYLGPYTGTTPPTYPGTVPTLYPTADDIAANLGDFFEIGNCPSIETEPTVERRPHYSSREGLKTKDLNPVVATEYTVNFQCDELSAKNMAMMNIGTLIEATGIIRGLTNGEQEYAMIFISNNPVGPKAHRYYRRGTISPNGSEQLIGDDYLVMDYMFEGLSDDSNYPSSPYFDMKYMTTTTTTSSTTTSTSSSTSSTSSSTTTTV